MSAFCPKQDRCSKHRDIRDVDAARLLGDAVFLSFNSELFFTWGMAVNFIWPLALNGTRFITAVAIVGAVALAMGQMSLWHFRAPWRHAVLSFLMASYFVLMFEGLKTADPISTSAVFTLTPIMAGIAGYVLLKQSMSRGVFLGMSGACCL